MPNHTTPRRPTAAKHLLCGALTLLITAYGRADTVYRCGDGYSPLTQCAHGTAAELKPSHELHSNTAESVNATAADSKQAQTLEKQRREAERRAPLTATPRIQPPAPPPPASSSPPLPRPGKYARRAPSPYFTAVDPQSRPQKKSTAKAVPTPKP